MGRAAALVSGKGGTGKTTLCAGIAAGLARLDQRVLCIDGDVGLRNLDLALGMSQMAVLPFTEAMEHPALLDKAPAHPFLPNLRLLTAPVARLGTQVDPQAFQRFVETAAQGYDWVLIDAPAGIGSGFRLAVGGCDMALVVANCEPASLRDGASTVRLLEDMGIRDIRLAVNRVRRKSLKRLGSTIDDAMDQTGLPLVGLVPEEPELTAALAAGQALKFYAAGGAVQACCNIAMRLMGKQTPLLRLRS